MLTQEELKAISERAEKATAGPWKFEHDHDLMGESHTQIYAEPCDNYEQHDHDCDFVAHSREDIPALLSMIQELSPGYETGYREGADSARADYDLALDETGFNKDEATPSNVAAYVKELEAKLNANRPNLNAFPANQ